MMRYLLPLWLLTSSLSFSLLAEEVPDLAARIRYQDRVTSSDGISKESQWQEKWLRVGDQVWSQRLIPLPLARAYHAAHDATPGHKHFTHQMAARWVTRNQQDELQLRYADNWHNQLVEVPEEEYGQVAFKPDWPRIRHLINPALLQEMTPLDEAAPEQARWYEKREGKQRTRILWSSRWQLPLVVESASLDGYRSYRMEVTLKPLPKALPWQQLEGYQTLDLRDFFD
ncbi:hypothetical protein [Aeromonas dhakensis]|uniref:hypothetical protein n=1 Tax=Aeromonas dhakensis TaxID=196024 RepID=UPI00037E2017|nr:hypothetical protein [Aeromonas dhakensis]KMK98281.1 hypothetical protein VL01_02575 [Aeromonas enteropelogenes]ELM3749572.1 hypothetical protein [Aeromonas dhakensis]MBL0679126.1 hypothetical protein [Aeromonas dhakensis]WAF78427.1 hypothetical protein NRL00_07570 [Aeromonas dhakensis]HDX8594640.1 hypothetical protein [Aeromonas dhakensis]